ncbi:FAD-dependent oxidoreductase [Opitutaceae bacterium TAV4]|nr:FAD-dependent oxidoreductase [Opitutaceae bacterium TAV4]
MTTTLELTPVFEAARLGYKRARIPALVCTDAGTLLAFCDVRRAPGDWSEIDTAISRSTDQGRTWSPPTIIARSGGQGKPATNPTPIVGSNGTIHFLYQYTYNQTLHITSTDDGLTWSAPNDITAVTESFRTEYNWKVFAPGPGHGIRLDTGPHAGRLLVPVWMCDPGGTSIPGGDHRPSCVATLYSDDEGRTWHRGAIAIHNSKKHVNPSENALAQLSDGRVYLNARSETPCHRRLVTTSPDGATNWTPATFDTALYEPVCMASVLSLNDPRTGKKVLLFCNPDSRYDPTEYNLVRFSPRENGVVKLSYDDGKTWAHSRVIDAGPFSYSDLAASPDGTIYCLYECGLRGRQPHHTNTHVGLARFSLRWIEEAPPPPPSNCDFLVVGSTPAGIAMAVRAARQGLRVILTNYHGHPGGMLANGLGVWDTLYEGHRSPIYDQLRSEIIEYYKTEYGENSPQHLAALPGATGHTNGRFEPKIAERYCRRLIEAENNITYYTPYTPVAVHREGRLIKTVILRETEGTMTIEITAAAVADCTYEGDLMAIIGTPHTIGREARTTHNEPHAGRIYLKSEPTPPPPPPRAASIIASLKLRHFGATHTIHPASTGEADNHVQACNYRTTLSSDPANRVLPTRPADYDPAHYAKLEYGSRVHKLPNNKTGWNRPQLIGLQTDYITGDLKKRHEILDAHWRATLGLLYYLQHDAPLSPEDRAWWREQGLARDEHAIHGHRPIEYYVREGRRLTGRSTITEHDFHLPPDTAPGHERAPLHADAIATTDWYLDTHACTTDRHPGTMDEGKMALHHETLPAQIPWRALLPSDTDNLLVPVCLSATHVAWGAIRLEPTWMHIAESAAWAAVLAHQQKIPPALVDTEQLLRAIADGRIMTTFFNDIDIADPTKPENAAIQYYATKGFFPTHNARPEEPITESVAKIWIQTAATCTRPDFDPNAIAHQLAQAEQQATTPHLTYPDLARMAADAGLHLPATTTDNAAPPTRATLCHLLYKATAKPAAALSQAQR